MGVCSRDIDANISKLFVSMIEVFKRLSCMLNVCKLSSIVDLSVSNCKWLHLSVYDSWLRMEFNVKWSLLC